MDDKNNLFEVAFSATIRSTIGSNGAIYLNSNSKPIQLDAVKAAKLIVKVQQFYDGLEEELAD